jgi:Rps23 Pro-64 3,4-dihydroxylase Tpa1-like proline 4-hydroxylase
MSETQLEIEKIYEAKRQELTPEAYADSIFNREGLDSFANAFSEGFKSSHPFPFIHFENILPRDIAKQVSEDFPDPDKLEYYRYDNPLEKKMAFDRIHRMPHSLASLFYQLNSPVFINFLERLTGIEGLIPDPYLRGGGLHLGMRGSKLDIHVDFNIHPKLNLYRRINVIIFLNKLWEPEWGGNLEFWEGFKNDIGDHYLLKRRESIAPSFNRFVCFEVSDKSYHGYPDPIRCPTRSPRKSIALYYYTSEAPEGYDETPHSTIYVKRPNDSNEHDELRKQRAKARLSTEINSDILS